MTYVLTGGLLFHGVLLLIVAWWHGWQVDDPTALDERWALGLLCLWAAREIFKENATSSPSEKDEA